MPETKQVLRIEAFRESELRDALAALDAIRKSSTDVQDNIEIVKLKAKTYPDKRIKPIHTACAVCCNETVAYRLSEKLECNYRRMSDEFVIECPWSNVYLTIGDADIEKIRLGDHPLWA